MAADEEGNYTTHRFIYEKEIKNDIPTTPHMSVIYINSAEC